MNCSTMAIEDLSLDENIPFIDYLKKQKLNDTLCHLIINSISLVDYNATTKEVFTLFCFLFVDYVKYLNLGCHKSKTILRFYRSLW